MGLRSPCVSIIPHYDEIKRKYEAGGTYRGIAAGYGCHYTAIQKALEKMGVKPRPRGHRPGDNGWGGRSRAEIRAAAQARRA